MEKMTNEKLDLLLKRHIAWHTGYAQMWQGWQLNLKKYDCSDMNFANCEIGEINAEFTNLRSASFFNCNMIYGNFHSSIFTNAKISSCNLRKSSFWCAFLENAHIHYSTLDGSSMKFADLKGTDISFCSLRDVDFTCAVMDKSTNIRFSDITGANFKGTIYDYSKSPDILPDFCYMKAYSGKTVLINKGEPYSYCVPAHMENVNPDMLNRAMGINDIQIAAMYQGVMNGWSVAEEYIKKYRNTSKDNCKEEEAIKKNGKER